MLICFFDQMLVRIRPVHTAIVQAVQVGQGIHHVRLVYEDNAFDLGAAISLAALVGCAVSTAAGLRKRKAGS